MGSSQVAAHTDRRTALVRRWRQAAQTRGELRTFPTQPSLTFPGNLGRRKGRRHVPACESPRNPAPEKTKTSLRSKIHAWKPIAARLPCVFLAACRPKHIFLSARRPKGYSGKPLEVSAPCPHVVPTHSTTRSSPWPQVYHATTVRNGRRGSRSNNSMATSLHKTTSVEGAETQHLPISSLTRNGIGARGRNSTP